MPIPDLPGTLIPRHSDQERWLKGHVAHLCGLDNPEKCVQACYAFSGALNGSYFLDFLAASLSALVSGIWQN